MISVSGLTGRGMRGAGQGIRAAIQRIATGATLAAAPLAPLFAESFELPGTIPSVVVTEDGLGANDQRATDLPDASFYEGFSAATCTDSCTTCGEGGCQCGGAGGASARFLQHLCGAHGKTGNCWVGRVESLVLWRNAPSNRPLFSYTVPDSIDLGPTALNADQLESDALIAPRVSLFRRNQCGESVEISYLYAGNFYSQRALPFIAEGYATSPPGIYGNVWGPETGTSLDSASATLIGNLQSAEFNRRTPIGIGATQFLFGFRWLQWYEKLQMTDGYADDVDPTIIGQDDYLTACTNNLYGGQIGLDSRLLGSVTGLRVEGLVKAGAYYNAASQRSSYSYFDNGGGSFENDIAVNSPGGASFVGEVGLTAVIPLSHAWDFRCGYFGLWLESIAQPVNQLSGQNLTQIPPSSGSLDLTGGLVVQGLSLGLEGRW